ncbi:hypothetical protein AM493_09815 [Flavobacterium akiainvivens]|uniref:Uncharacterized protein n=1 Tax=Flavobacterium akiainvivens TaxID=1202724 RepID=A0A0M9VI53_9FLAO|nr:hypothetical protein [Flavobacterium akiainvivens]KOS06296.1 hypothetical protein AM493_09815 [Flavobacterium akiainvivens]SFQ16959.1 hypothetical protein SAMN05444144_101402 [Flavobacterium akiainvivens]
MNKFLLCLLFSGLCFGQKITVAELNLKLDGNTQEEVMYGFAVGDKIVLEMQATGSAFGEVKVYQYPNTEVPVYTATAVKEEKKEFTVLNKSVYLFRFKNTVTGKRSLNVTIQRVPKNSSTKDFNTAVKWVSVNDTAYAPEEKSIVVGYDTLHTQKTRKVVASEQKYEEVVMDKSQRVSAKTSFGDTRTSVNFSLPANAISAYETKKVVAWAYWVGVGEESNEFWKQNRKMIVGAVQGAASYFSTPLGGIAAGAIANLAMPVNGEDVEYALVNEANCKLFTDGKACKPFDSGKGIAAYKRFTDATMLQGKYYVALANDNYVQPIDVNVKVSAIIEHIKYKDEKYTDTAITPRYEKKTVQKMVLTPKKIPVTFDYK